MNGARLTDQPYLREEQYREPTNLRARMALHERFSTNRLGWPRWVFDQLALAPGARVLELGCGPGQLWIENVERLPASLDLTLGDYSLGMVAAARARLHDRAPNLTIAVANIDAQALPLPANTFDVVIANHMLYHVPDRPRVYAEVRRVLRPGGHFYAATNGAGHMRELSDFVAEVSGERDDPSRVSFRLDNGGAELAAVFDAVELRRYNDALIVDEAAPLLDYILSAAALAPEQRQRLSARIARTLTDEGAIRVTKETGLFQSLKNDRP